MFFLMFFLKQKLKRMEAPVSMHNSITSPFIYTFNNTVTTPLVEVDALPVKQSALSSHFILTVKSVGYKRVHGDEYFIKFKNI